MEQAIVQTSPAVIQPPSAPVGNPKVQIGDRLPQKAESDHPVPQGSRAQVQRHGVLRHLDRAANRRLTLIVAPAGSGKTTALAQWATTLAAPVRWVAATPDAKATWSAFQAALRHAAQAPTRAVLIVDDAHLLPQQAWQAIEAWLDGPDSERANLVLAGRRDLPLLTAVLALTDQVTELRSDVVSFTESEARELIALHAPSVSDLDAAAVQERASGWAAALVLGARAMARADQPLRARRTLHQTERPVLDYLLGEVFATLPAQSRHVLLCTGDLDDVSENEAVVLSGDSAAGLRLAGLAAEGFFITQHQSGEACVWTYHPLLRELLRRQTAFAGPDRTLAIAAHMRAARYYAVHGPLTDAIRHAMRAHDHAYLAALLIAEAPALIGTGNADLLFAAVRSLPAGSAERSPQLLGISALAHLSVGDLETAARLATWVSPTVERLRFETDRDDDGAGSAPDVSTILADGALLELWQVRLGRLDPRVAVRSARQLLGCTARGCSAERQQVIHPGHRLAPALSLPRLVWLLNELTVTELWIGEVEFARAHNAEALECAEAVGYPRLAGEAWTNRAMLDLIVGRCGNAAAAAERALAVLADSSGHDDAPSVQCHAVLAWIALEEFKFDDALGHLTVANRIGIPAGTPLGRAFIGTLRAALAAEAGDVAAARALLWPVTLGVNEPAGPLDRYLLRVRAEWAFRSAEADELQRLIRQMRERDWTDGVALYSPMLEALRGDRPSAITKLESFSSTHLDGELGTIAAAARLALLLQSGDSSALCPAYHDVLDRLSTQRSFKSLTYTGVTSSELQALVRRDTNSTNPHPLTAEIGQALLRYRAFRRRAREGVLSKDVGVALTLAPLTLDGPGPDVISTPAQEACSSKKADRQAASGLTARELDVLDELALGGAYSDIAHNLYVTENTVKTHILNLYRKLGVDRRSDALRQARERGLLQ